MALQFPNEKTTHCPFGAKVLVVDYPTSRKLMAVAIDNKDKIFALLTPAKAREIAAALIEAADRMEGKNQ